MRKLNFKEWIDIFQFDKEDKIQANDVDDDLPIKVFNLEYLIDLLMKNTIPLGNPFSRFPSEIQWGVNPGAIKVTITPRLNVKIQRLFHDFEGNSLWIMKRYYFINDEKFGGKETDVADDIFQAVEEVSKENMEAPLKESKDFNFEDFVYSLTNVLKNQKHNSIQYDGIYKINENEYDLKFWVKGGGVGMLRGSETGQRQALAFIVKASYNESTGVIRVINEVLQASDDTANWEIQPAEYDAVYLPTQGKKEIIDTVVTSLKWF